VQAQAEITYWKTKYYRMKDRFTALEAKHPKKAPKLGMYKHSNG
jgi:hypothetical protein